MDREGKEANKGCVIKQGSSVSNWSLILMGTLGVSLEHVLELPFQYKGYLQTVSHQFVTGGCSRGH